MVAGFGHVPPPQDRKPQKGVLVDPPAGVKGGELAIAVAADRLGAQAERLEDVQHSQAHRAEVLASLACVDYVTIFDEPDPLVLIELIKPHVLAKGADWEEDQIIGSEFVKANGGRVARIPLEPDISTSKIIETIIQIHNG